MIKLDYCIICRTLNNGYFLQYLLVKITNTFSTCDEILGTRLRKLQRHNYTFAIITTLTTSCYYFHGRWLNLHIFRNFLHIGKILNDECRLRMLKNSTLLHIIQFCSIRVIGTAPSTKGWNEARAAPHKWVSTKSYEGRFQKRHARKIFSAFHRRRNYNF